MSLWKLYIDKLYLVMLVYQEFLGVHLHYLDSLI